VTDLKTVKLKEDESNDDSKNSKDDDDDVPITSNEDKDHPDGHDDSSTSGAGSTTATSSSAASDGLGDEGAVDNSHDDNGDAMEFDDDDGSSDDSEEEAKKHLKGGATRVKKPRPRGIGARRVLIRLYDTLLITPMHRYSGLFSLTSTHITFSGSELITGSNFDWSNKDAYESSSSTYDRKKKPKVKYLRRPLKSIRLLLPRLYLLRESALEIFW
jgi:hypothetical protein